MGEERRPPSLESLDPEQVESRLRELIRDDSRLREWIELGFLAVTPERLGDAVSRNLDLVRLCFNHWHLGHWLVAPWARMVLRAYWRLVEYYVKNPSVLYHLFSKRDEGLKRVLDTYEGRMYLIRQCERAYHSLYAFAWKGSRLP